MNAKDKQDLELVHYRLDELDKRLQEMRRVMRDDHKKVDQSLSFIKENLFNPNEGLWAETKENSQFREDAGRWRGMIGAGFIGLFFKQIYDLFTNT